MKKKVALTAAAVAMVGTLAVGGTLAWFTDTETATNVVTMGEVDIKLSEDGKSDGDIISGGLTYDDVMPGDEFAKEVKIENLEQAAWVRAKITVDGFDGVTTTNSDKIEFYKYNASGVGEEVTVAWTGNDGVGTVGPWKMEAKDAEDYILFDYVKVPTNWGNEFTNASFTIKVEVEAIQYDNNTDSAKAFTDFAFGTVPNLKDATTNTTDDTGKYTTASPAEADIVE